MYYVVHTLHSNHNNNNNIYSTLVTKGGGYIATPSTPPGSALDVACILSEQTGMKLSCIKPTSKVRGLSIEPCSSTVCID